MAAYLRTITCLLLSLVLISTPLAQADPDSTYTCTDHMAGNVPDLQQIQADIDNQLARFTPAEHAEAKRKAAELSNDWSRTAEKHLMLSGKWGIYVLMPAYVGELVMAQFRAYDVWNPLTMHYSNFAEGIAMLGVVHNMWCGVEALCNAAQARLATPKFKGRMSKIVNLLRGGAYSRQRAFWGTAALFTAANAYFELSGLDSSYIDYEDFYSGQMGLVVYYYLQRVINK